MKGGQSKSNQMSMEESPRKPSQGVVYEADSTANRDVSKVGQEYDMI